MFEEKKSLQIGYGPAVAMALMMVVIGGLLGMWLTLLLAEPPELSETSQLMEQLTDLKFGVIDWTLEDGSERQFTCEKLVVNGPYAMDQEAWLMVDGEQGMQTYLHGSYETLAAGGPYYLHQPDASWNNQGVTAYWLMQVGDCYYTVEARYADYELNSEKYEGQSGSLWHPEYFNVEAWVLTGQNSFAEKDMVRVRYDDERTIRESTQKWATWVVLDPAQG